MYSNKGLVSLKTVALKWFGIFSSWLVRIHDNKVKQNTLRQNCSCQFWDPHSVMMKIVLFVVPDQNNWRGEGSHPLWGFTASLLRLINQVLPIGKLEGFLLCFMEVEQLQVMCVCLSERELLISIQLLFLWNNHDGSELHQLWNFIKNSQPFNHCLLNYWAVYKNPRTTHTKQRNWPQTEQKMPPSTNPSYQPDHSPDGDICLGQEHWCLSVWCSGTVRGEKQQCLHPNSFILLPLPTRLSTYANHPGAAPGW